MTIKRRLIIVLNLLLSAMAALTACGILTMLIITEERNVATYLISPLLFAVWGLIAGSIPLFLIGYPLILYALKKNHTKLWHALTYGFFGSLVLPLAFFIFTLLFYTADDLEGKIFFFQISSALFCSTGTVTAALFWYCDIRPRNEAKINA